ncbi:hypothetical protein CDD83_6374 [Cordyceps sp. RAO-2017]|nr:hypothetical protein CDD83_6374 [Cordyceps sp. RAO-2017]
MACSASASGSAWAASSPARPRMNSWSRTSMADDSSRPDSASVRASSRFSHPMTSHWKRAALSRLTCSPVGTSTLPARWPHFLPPCSWSSKCTAAAPCSANSLASLSTAERPPWPVSPSATIGRR